MKVFDYANDVLVYDIEKHTIILDSLLSQKSAACYDNSLKSYNVPELGCEKLVFVAADVANAIATDAIDFR